MVSLVVVILMGQVRMAEQMATMSNVCGRQSSSEVKFSSRMELRMMLSFCSRVRFTAEDAADGNDVVFIVEFFGDVNGEGSDVVFFAESADGFGGAVEVGYAVVDFEPTFRGEVVFAGGLLFYNVFDLTDWVNDGGADGFAVPDGGAGGGYVVKF